jgi:hypothetical protein
MPDWKTRLAVSYEDENGTHNATPVDAMTPNFALNAEPLHSVEATHIGVVYSPQALTFTLTVKTIGAAAADLTALALEGRRFNIIMQEAEGGTDWSFKKIVMSQCVITSASTGAPLAGAPTATFSGFSLAASSEPKQGEAVSVPR